MLSYSKSWLASSHRRPISLSLPLQEPTDPHDGPEVAAYFENLLPDNLDIRTRIQKQVGAQSTDAIDLLAEIGRECVGALQFTKPGTEPEDVKTLEGTPLEERRIEEILATLPYGTQGDQSNFRFSIAGAHEKWALLWHRGRWCEPRGSTPSTHIFKLPMGVTSEGVDLSDSVENEWLCSRILKAWGTSTANSRLERFGGQRALVVERFDRQLAKDGRWIVRLPQEDLAQATGTAPEAKYEKEGGPGTRQVLDLLLGSADALADRRDFFRTQIQFFLLCAIDGHAKNFSVFLEPEGTFRLTPRYDVISAHPVLGNSRGRIPRQKVKMAMAVWGRNRHYEWETIHRRHYKQTAKDCGLDVDADEVIDELCRTTADVIVRVQSEIPPHFPEHVATRIFDGLTETADRLAGRTTTRSTKPVP